MQMLSLSLILLLAQPLCAQEATLRPFPDIVREMKQSIVYVQVGTNVEGQVMVGSGFVIKHTDRLVAIATCHHTLFDSLTLDTLTLYPDTSKITVKFLNSDQHVKAHWIAGREDRDIAILRTVLKPGAPRQIALRAIVPGSTNDIIEGLDAGFTGYESTIRTKDFGKVNYWPFTRRGIVSSLHNIGPGDHRYLDYFYVDMIITKGGSGGPIYDAATGKILGMFNRYYHYAGTTASKGLSECVPIWAIVTVWDDYLNSENKQ